MLVAAQEEEQGERVSLMALLLEQTDRQWSAAAGPEEKEAAPSLAEEARRGRGHPLRRLIVATGGAAAVA